MEQKIKMCHNLSGREFISLVNLIINFQEKIKKINKSDPLLECKIREIGASLSYSYKFGEVYGGIPLNRALEMYYSKLNSELKLININ